jgi:hypothetical protein
MNGYYVFEQHSIASVANDSVLTKSGIHIQLINHDTYWKLSVLQLKLKQFESIVETLPTYDLIP